VNLHAPESVTPPPRILPQQGWAGSASLGRRRLIERFTFTLPLLLVLVFAVQAIAARFLNGSPFENSHNINSIVGAIAVNIAAVLTYREFRKTPGTKRFAFILTSYGLPVLVLAGVLLVFRVPYSNVVLWTGLGFGAFFMLLLGLVQRPSAGRVLFLVPGERTKELARELVHETTQFLESPDQLGLAGHGAVVADLHQELSPEWERGIAHAVIHGIAVYNVKQVRESITGKVQIERLSENSFGALVPSHSYFIIKRLTDVVGSLAGLILFAIPMLLIALAIRLTSPGDAFFRHRRTGYRGRPFEAYKFRTMVSREHDDHDLESQKTADNDPRITPIGSFLRRTRLDELPQLINVLRGEMSLIGPRPEALALSKWYHEHLDFYEYRHVVRPGITGWAQVNQGHVTELDDVYVKLQYDFYYIKNISAWLDLLIALRTVAVMVHFRGAR